MDAPKMGGQVAQLVEHHLSKQKVASSNPSSYRIYVASRSTQPNAREIVCEG